MPMSVSDDRKGITVATVPEMRILRRPKSDELVARDARPQKNRETGQQKPKTLEEKQAAYEEARSRILGSDYMPDTASTAEVPSSPVASRNRSPEILRRRPSPPEPMFAPCYLPPPLLQQYPMHPGNFVPISTQPYFYIDTSRPPPPLPQMPAIHYTPPSQSITSCIPRVETLGSAMQIVVPRQAQRKNRHKKKKSKATAE